MVIFHSYVNVYQRVLFVIIYHSTNHPSIHLQGFHMVPPISERFGSPHLWDIEISIQWIGLRENLQETIDFPIEYGAFL